MSRDERKAMIRCGHPDLSSSRQCRLLSINRSTFYYAAMGESPENLALMRRIDELFLKYPFYGSRQMARQLRREGILELQGMHNPGMAGADHSNTLWRLLTLELWLRLQEDQFSPSDSDRPAQLGQSVTDPTA